MKKIFIVINLVLLTFLAFSGVEIMYKVIASSLTATPIHIKEKVSFENNNKKQSMLRKSNYNKIIKKNILKVIIDRNVTHKDKKDNDEDIAELKATPLNLKLLGTIAGENMEDAYAVIKDKKTKVQSLYQVGESVQDAKIIKILRQKIVLNYNGEDQILEMNFGPKMKKEIKKK